MAINTKLSLKGCWRMVNKIQNGRTPEEVRERCVIAKAWLDKNEIISNDEYNDLMMTVALIHRESYHTA